MSKQSGKPRARDADFASRLIDSVQARSRPYKLVDRLGREKYLLLTEIIRAWAARDPRPDASAMARKIHQSLGLGDLMTIQAVRILLYDAK